MSDEMNGDDHGDDIGYDFYFESDELALKGNVDYLNLLRTVTVLEAQRSKAIKDIDRLIECERTALADPIRFVERLQQDDTTRNSLDLPALQQIATLPVIDWDKYTKSFGCLSSAGGGGGVGGTQPHYGGLLGSNHRHMTRQIKKIVGGSGGGGGESAEQQASSSTSSSSSSNGTAETALDQTSVMIHSRSADFGGSSSAETAAAIDKLIVRGRLCNFGKPQTFNQLWTVEEQKRLEDLLVKFPPEDVEARRWEKIATALGNRTPQQVASRVQKYFIKLTKAGLPVPGRMPSLAFSKRPFPRNVPQHKHHRHNRFLFGSSTFMASHEPPVFMSDLDEEASNSNDLDWTDGDEVDDDEDIPIELRQTDEYRELLFMRQMRRKKLGDGVRGGSRGQHFGYSCDSCNCEPIVGTRWHCVDCPADVTVDLCETCVDGQFENGVHRSSHCMEPIKSSQVDGDYTRFMRGDYNYLDPNYMPACN